MMKCEYGLIAAALKRFPLARKALRDELRECGLTERVEGIESAPSAATDAKEVTIGRAVVIWFHKDVTPPSSKQEYS